MKILYDNIIFNLQRSGGISLYWGELMKRQLKNFNPSISFLERDSISHQNMFRNRLQVPDFNIIKRPSFFHLNIERYLNVSHTIDFNVFHSSYYRSISNTSKNYVSIVTVHDFIYEHYVKGIRKTIHSWQKEKALSKADGIICVSKSTKSDLLKLYPEFSDKPIRLIYNGVCEGYKTIDKVSAYIFLHKKYNIQYPFILHVGDRNANYKNFDLVVEAVKNSPSYSLILVGGGELNQRELALLEKKLKGNYIHLQYIPESDLNMFYNIAHCLLYLSSYEGFGLPLVEAQKAGCPVVACNNSSIPEIVANKSSLIEELTVDVVTKKISQLEELPYRTSVIDEGLQNSSNFSWDSCYSETTDFYREVYNNTMLQSKKHL